MTDALVLGIGNALTDVCVNANDDLLRELDLPKGSMQLIEATHSRGLLAKLNCDKMCAGGCASNTITGMGRLGLKTAFIGKVGRDDLGARFAENLRDHGVESRLIESDSPSGTAIALVTPDGERTFATFLGAAVELSADELAPAQFADASYFHIEGYLVQNHELIRRAVELARQAGATISMDLASYNVVAENLEFLRGLVGTGIDILFANEDEAQAFTGEEDEEKALEALAEQCRIAVVKLGKRGSLLARGEERVHIPIKPVKPVDTTGAGDLYATGFLYGVVQQAPLEVCGRFGSIIAAEIIQTLGAHMDAPTWDRIRQAYPQA